MNNLLIEKSAPGLVSISGLPTKVTIFGAFEGDWQRIESVKTDLLVITHLEHMRLGHGPQRFDELLGNRISQAVADAHFAGNLGDSLLVETADQKIKRVLIVGLGKPDTFGRPNLCGLFRMIFESARATGATKVSIPIFPGRLTDLNLKGTAAVLRCKLSLLGSQGALGDLDEVEILCAPQATRHLLSGFSVEQQLCRVCKNPKID